MVFCQWLIIGSIPGSDRAFTVPSPLLRSSSSFAEQRANLQCISPHSKPCLGSDAGLISPNITKNNKGTFTSFKFPQGSTDPEHISKPHPAVGTEMPPDSFRRALSSKPHDSANSIKQSDLHDKVNASASITNTPRSSGELGSISNNSTETLASEYITRETSRLVHKPANSRRSSSLMPLKGQKSEILMMGYAQLAGSFTLDGSLVNQNLFEGVKKKAIVGGHSGGGVVRSDSSKRNSGLLGSLGWGNIGDSLGGFLGNNETSSMKDSKATGNSRSIPIISTPQSILFVDLRLEPGESKCYSYRHPLPKGIPPTHKGRAVKISYNLVIGTQRAANIDQQHQMQHASIPFKVLSSVNGKSLGLSRFNPVS